MHNMVYTDIFSIHRLPAHLVVSMPASQLGPRPAVGVSKQRHRTLATANDVDTSRILQSERTDPTAEQVRQRMRRRVKSWRDPLTPNTGLISVTSKTNTAQAAACVAADLLDTPVTRIVAETPGEVAQAVSIIEIATKMINTPTQQQQQDQPASAAVQHQEQQQQQVADADADATAATAPKAAQKPAALVPKQLLVFQPMLISGLLVSPPELPSGAHALYTYKQSADHHIIRQAMRRRAAAAEAAEAGDGGSNSSSSSRNQLSSVNINTTSDVRGAGTVIAGLIRKHGWAELNCYGGPLATAKGIEALIVARGALGQNPHDRRILDVCAIFLGFWKKDPSSAAGQQQQEETADVVDAEGASGQQQEDVGTAAAAGEGGGEAGGPLPYRCSRFLLLSCAKNKPLALQNSLPTRRIRTIERSEGRRPRLNKIKSG